MNEKATIFIEGLERFIEPYITALEDELEIEILSLKILSLIITQQLY